jgi:hypothetical protein
LNRGIRVLQTAITIKKYWLIHAIVQNNKSQLSTIYPLSIIIFPACIVFIHNNAMAYALLSKAYYTTNYAENQYIAT